MEEIIRLLIERNTKRKILSKDDIKLICNAIISLKGYELYVNKIIFLKSKNSDGETIAAYNGTELLFYADGLIKLIDTIDKRILDGTKIDMINYYILSTIFHEFAHVRQSRMIDLYYCNEAKIYRICDELRHDKHFCRNNYKIMLDEVNAFNLGELNANRVYQALPNYIITTKDKDMYRSFPIEILLSKYQVNLKDELIISPSEQLLEKTKEYNLSKWSYDYDYFKKVINDSQKYSLFNKLLLGLPISFEDYAYTKMFKENYDINENYTYIRKLQKRK